jgi:hypothetical protein
LVAEGKSVSETLLTIFVKNFYSRKS